MERYVAHALEGRASWAPLAAAAEVDVNRKSRTLPLYEDATSYSGDKPPAPILLATDLAEADGIVGNAETLEWTSCHCGDALRYI